MFTLEVSSMSFSKDSSTVWTNCSLSDSTAPYKTILLNVEVPYAAEKTFDDYSTEAKVQALEIIEQISDDILGNA